MTFVLLFERDLNKMNFPEVGKYVPVVAMEIFEQLKPYPIQIREKYLKQTIKGTSCYSVTLDDYMQHAGWAEENELVCPEDYSYEFSKIVQKTASDFEIFTNNIDRVAVHAGYCGSVTPLHFDWDISEIQHLSIYGRRRIWICPPNHLHVFPTEGNSILADFEEMGSDERAQTLIQFGAVYFDLKEGEFIKFPSFWWHLVEYLEDSAAISMRRELDPILRPITTLPRSLILQYLLKNLAHAATEKKLNAMARLIQAYLSTCNKGEKSSLNYSSTINQLILEFGLEPIQNAPMTKCGNIKRLAVPRAHRVNSLADDANIHEINLCKEWMFGHWPTLNLLSSMEMSKFSEELFLKLAQ